MFGDSQSLVLHISRPSRIAAQTNESPTSRSDLAAVNYFLAVRGDTGLAGQVAQAAYNGALLTLAQAPSQASRDWRVIVSWCNTRVCRAIWRRCPLMPGSSPLKSSP
ncbi:MAG: hypothetical protein R3B91_15425 [Planctomycetaceae bacterium]